MEGKKGEGRGGAPDQRGPERGGKREKGRKAGVEGVEDGLWEGEKGGEGCWEAGR